MSGTCLLLLLLQTATVPAEGVAPAPPRWEPLPKEVNDAAEGSLQVCSTVLLPVSLVPGAGEAASTALRWLCVAPAALAVDYVAVQHGDLNGRAWQAVAALSVQQLWETLLAVPVPFTVVAVALGSASLTPQLAALGLPNNLLAGAGLAAVTAAFALTDRFGETGGRWLFRVTYGLLTEPIEGSELDALRAGQWLQPAHDGVREIGPVTATYAMVSAAAGAAPTFRWGHVVPILGPIERSREHAAAVKEKMRRVGRDVLAVDKRDLGAMDATEDVLSSVQGYGRALGQSALIVSVCMAGAGVVASNGGTALTARNLGDASLVAATGAAGFFLVAQLADAVRPALVAAVYAFSE